MSKIQRNGTDIVAGLVAIYLIVNSGIAIKNNMSPEASANGWIVVTLFAVVGGMFLGISINHIIVREGLFGNKKPAKQAKKPRKQ